MTKDEASVIINAEVERYTAGSKTGDERGDNEARKFLLLWTVIQSAMGVTPQSPVVTETDLSNSPNQ